MQNTVKLFLLIILNAFLFTAIQAQEWKTISPSFNPSGNYNLYMGTFIDENTGWAVSKHGRIWKTIDGGYNWLMQKDSMDYDFVDINFIDSRCGWLSCYIKYPEPSFLLRTNNGGNTWETIPLPDTATAGLFVIDFLDSLKGFAGGWNNEFYYSEDGGIIWIDISRENALFGSLNDIFFVDSLNGWAVGESYDAFDSGVIINTEDGGLNWNTLMPYTYRLNSIFFINKTTGYSVGFDAYKFGVIMSTQNEGETWLDTSLISPKLYDIIFPNDSIGWAIGDLGYIWNSQDSGKTWIKIESETEEKLNRIVFVNNNRVGYIFGENCTILKYTYNNSFIDNKKIPSNFTLNQNYPNPFNPTTTIDYAIREDSDVKLSIYDISGHLIETLVDNYHQAGAYRVKWNASKYSSGIYIYRLESSYGIHSRKMVLLK